MNSHQATVIFVLLCCGGGLCRTVRANIVDGLRYYSPHHHRIGGGYLYSTRPYHRGSQQHRNIGLIGSGIGASRLSQLPALASIATTSALAMPRNNYNFGHRPYQNVIIPMSPYFWSAPRSGLHRGNDYYHGLGSVTVIGRNQQQLFGRSIPKKTRKIIINGPGGHVSQSFIREPNTHYGGVYC